MPRSTLSLLLAALLAAPAVAPVARAQAADSAGVGARPIAVPTSGSPNDGCTYDLCALRIEEGIVVQGLHGQQIATTGVLGGLSGRIDWRSDTARAYARRAESRQRTALLLRGASVVTSAAGTVFGYLALRDAGSFGGTASSGAGQTQLYTALGLGAGSWVLSTLSRPVQRQARQQLARAVWWHNRELVRAQR